MFATPVSAAAASASAASASVASAASAVAPKAGKVLVWRRRKRRWIGPFSLLCLLSPANSPSPRRWGQWSSPIVLTHIFESHHLIACHIMPSLVLLRFKSFHVLSSHSMSYLTISRHFTPCLSVSIEGKMSPDILSCHIMSYHVIPCHVMPYLASYFYCMFPLVCSDGGDQYEEESIDGQMSPDVASESLQSESEIFSSHHSTGKTVLSCLVSSRLFIVFSSSFCVSSCFLASCHLLRSEAFINYPRMGKIIFFS